MDDSTDWLCLSLSSQEFSNIISKSQFFYGNFQGSFCQEPIPTHDVGVHYLSNIEHNMRNMESSIFCPNIETIRSIILLRILANLQE